MTIIDKKKEYYILYNELVEKVRKTKNGNTLFKGVAFPRTSWEVPESRAELIKEPLNIKFFTKRHVENNCYIEKAEVYLDDRICVTYTNSDFRAERLNENLHNIPVKSLEVDIKDGVVLYYFKTK